MDKISHFVAYLSLSASLYIARLEWIKNNKSNVIWLGIMCSFGIFIEIIQKFMTDSRIFDILDILANTAGILIGYLLIKSLK